MKFIRTGNIDVDIGINVRKIITEELKNLNYNTVYRVLKKLQGNKKNM